MGREIELGKGLGGCFLFIQLLLGEYPKIINVLFSSAIQFIHQVFLYCSTVFMSYILCMDLRTML
jgi:hypothetical protein